MINHPDQTVTIRVTVRARSRQHALAKIQVWLGPALAFGLRWAPIDEALAVVADLAHQTEDRTEAEEAALRIVSDPGDDRRTTGIACPACGSGNSAFLQMLNVGGERRLVQLECRSCCGWFTWDAEEGT